VINLLLAIGFIQIVVWAIGFIAFSTYAIIHILIAILAITMLIEIAKKYQIKK